METKRSNRLLMVALLMAVALIVVALFLLPPFAFGERLFGWGADADPAVVVVDAGSDSAEEPPLQVTSIAGKIQVDTTAAIVVEEVAEVGEPLPTAVAQQGSLYRIAHSEAAAGTVRIAAPSGTDMRLVDLYGLRDGQWGYIASSVQGDEVVSAAVELPEAVAVVSTDKPQEIVLGMEILPGGSMPPALQPLINELSVGTLTLGPDGVLLGEPVLVQPGSYAEFLRVTNTGVVVDTGSLLSLLTNAETTQRHIEDLANLAVSGDYAGINLDYQGVPAAQKDEFTRFVQQLDTALEAQDRMLVVTLTAPELVNQAWRTQGHDWIALGAAADAVYLQLPLDPRIFAEGAMAEQILAWATDQVDRHKLTLLLHGGPVDEVSALFAPIARDRALSHFGTLQLLQGGEQITAGETLEVGLAGNAGVLEWDGEAATYKYNYEQAGQTHTVYLANERALANQIGLAERYNVRGVVVRGLTGIADGSDYALALESLMGEEPPMSKAAAIVWTVTDDSGDVVASHTSANDFTFAVDNLEAAGSYTLRADFAMGAAQAPLGSFDFEVVEAVAQEPTDTETTDGETTDGETADVDTTDGETADTDESETEETTSAEAGSTGAVTNIETNFRQGPGFYYAVDSVLDSGIRVDVLGRDSSGSWLNVRLPGSGQEGWLYYNLVDFEGGVTLGDLLVIGAPSGVAIQPVPVVVAPVVTPEPTAQPTAVPTPAGPTATPAPIGPWFTPTPQPTPTRVWPTATPKPQGPWATATPRPGQAVQPAPIAPPAANLGGGFELGGQTHHFGNPTLMRDIGMNWVKFQHKWSAGESPNAVADRIANAKANGFKVLLSIPGADLNPSSIDFAGYVNFLRGVASLNPPPDAIEVWNENNIDREWPAGQISPTDYVNRMLRPAYQAIKAANPSVMVISGAPAPTGFDNNTNAWADDRYMRGMAAAGGASFMDCVGAHYNAGATAPGQQTGHPADDGRAHYSWYFLPTLNMYYNSMGGSRKVCFTEVGFLSTQDYGGTPAAFRWAGSTTVGQHAQWLADAVRLSANSGKVRMLIIFNVDFTHFDANGDPQAGYALIRPNGSCPACPLIKGVMGR